MNPLHLTARNYRSFESLDLDLPTGCVAILGENGAGKSSIVNAIDLAVFGPESRSLADALSEGCFDEELLLELEFEHAGGLYRVRRTFSPRGRGKTTLDFEKSVPDYDESDLRAGVALARQGIDPGLYHDRWEPLTCESAKATQELIEHTIGLSRDTFRASAFLAQGDGAAFTEAQPRDRKRILGEVLGLERWQTLAECARVDRRLLETRQAALAGKAQQAEEQAQLLPALEREQADTVEAITVHADNVADLERSHAELAVQYQAAREHAARLAAAAAELKEAEAALATMLQRNADADAAARTHASALAELEQLPAHPPIAEVRAREVELVAACDAHARAVSDHNTTSQLAGAAAKQIIDLDRRAVEHQQRAQELGRQARALEEALHDQATCDRCKQVLAGDSRAHAVVSLGVEANGHLDEAKRLGAEASKIAPPVIPPMPAGVPPTVELELARKTIEAIGAVAATRGVLAERIKQAETVAASGPSAEQFNAATLVVGLKQAVLEDVGAPPNVDALTAQGRLVGDQLKAARTALDTHTQQRARLDERITVAKKAADSLVEAADERKELDDSLQVVAALERAFSPDGIPALIVENSAIPYLETEANRILGELGTAYRVELRTQAALKSGEGLRDTLDVIVRSETGERAYETFSGGERTRINLALRIALARLLAHRRGAESRLLCIDEPEFLDEQGTAALVDVLRGLEDDFDKLYVVSHVPSLRDSFDTTLSVVRDEQGSRVVEAGVFEAVPA